MLTKSNFLILSQLVRVGTELSSQNSNSRRRKSDEEKVGHFRSCSALDPACTVVRTGGDHRAAHPPECAPGGLHKCLQPEVQGQIPGYHGECLRGELE